MSLVLLCLFDRMEKIAMKKFELTADRIEEKGVTLHRIKALIDFGDVKAGELGGYVEKEENLSQYGNAWVYRHAKVFGNAYIYGNACVCGNALVYGNAWLSGKALVYGNAQVFGEARVYKNAQVLGNARICDYARIFDNVRIYDNARIFGDAQVFGNAWVYGNAEVYDDAHIYGNAEVYDDAEVYSNARVRSNADYIYLKGFGSHNRSTTIFRTKSENICVSCGCFIGSLQEFENKVKETHGNNKFAKEYLALVEAAKIHFEV